MVLQKLAFALRELAGPPYRVAASLHILTPLHPPFFIGNCLSAVWKASPARTSNRWSWLSSLGGLDEWESVRRCGFDYLRCSSVGVWFWSQHAREHMSSSLPSHICSTEQLNQEDGLAPAQERGMDATSASCPQQNLMQHPNPLAPACRMEPNDSHNYSSLMEHLVYQYDKALAAQQQYIMDLMSFGAHLNQWCRQLVKEQQCHQNRITELESMVSTYKKMAETLGRDLLAAKELIFQKTATVYKLDDQIAKLLHPQSSFLWTQYTATSPDSGISDSTNVPFKETGWKAAEVCNLAGGQETCHSSSLACCVTGEEPHFPESPFALIAAKMQLK